MIEKMLQLVADVIDGKLCVCDDGFVIESWVEGLRADYLFNEDGELEKVEIKNLKTSFDDNHKLIATITND